MRVIRMCCTPTQTSLGINILQTQIDIYLYIPIFYYYVALGSHSATVDVYIMAKLHHIIEL